MNFKEEYKRTFPEGQADDAFKKHLADELERKMTNEVKIKTFPYAKLMALAAALFFMIGIGYFSGMLSGRQQGDEVPGDMLAQEENNIVDIEMENGILAGTESSDGYVDLELPPSESGEEEDKGIGEVWADFWEKVNQIFK